MKRYSLLMVFVGLFMVMGDGCKKEEAPVDTWCATCSCDYKKTEDFCGTIDQVENFIYWYKAGVPSYYPVTCTKQH